MIRVLVAGSRGFVGRRVTAALAASSWARPVELAPRARLDELLMQVDCVANCLTGDPGSILAGASALFAAAANAPRRLPIVHLSSMTVYGSRCGSVDESGPTPGDLGPYSASQRDADRLAAGYPEAIRLRPGCEYGPDCLAWTARVAHWLVRRRLGDLGAAGDGYCNLLFVDDLVAAILQALRRPELRGGAFNLALPAPPTWNEYFIAFAKALGAVPVRRVTRRRLMVETKLLAPPLKVLESLCARAGLGALSLPPPIPPSLLRTCSQDLRLDVHRAESALGIEWTPLALGLDRAAAWCRTTAR